jgi:hypothetical protein
MALKLGTVVRQKVTPIEGPVAAYDLDKDNGSTLFLVEYTNDEGEPASRYFKEEELEVVPVPAVLLQAAEAPAKKK